VAAFGVRFMMLVRSKLDCDVIIAGAGPAGAAAAIHMANAGLRVVLVDSQVFPRDKVCGDFLSPGALRELQALGLTRLAEFKRSNLIRDAALFLDGTHLVTSRVPRLPDSHASRVIPRKTLDNWIVARARDVGAEIREEYRVTAFAKDKAGIEVWLQGSEGTRKLTAQLLVGADGSSSLVARVMRGHGALDDDRIIAVRGYFEGVNGPANQADLYFTTDSFPGYCWLFPAGASIANVGVGMILKTLPPRGDHLRTLLLRLIEADPALQKRLAGARLVGNIIGWPLTTFNGRLSLVSDRVMLIGDAAGLINPLNGEGIHNALVSARFAADTVMACMEHGDFSEGMLQTYAARIDTELGQDLALARAAVQLIRNRSLNSFWLEALRIIAAKAATDPDYAYLTGGVLAGVIATRDILRLNVVSKTLEQAALRLSYRTSRDPSLRPNGLVELGIGVSQSAIDIASTMLRNRDASEQWMLGVASSAMGLMTRGRKGAPARAKRGMASIRTSTRVNGIRPVPDRPSVQNGGED
jgi:geranylgeranyl reductase family protein